MTDRQTGRETECERERQTERERETKTETETETERERERERENLTKALSGDGIAEIGSYTTPLVSS